MVASRHIAGFALAGCLITISGCSPVGMGMTVASLAASAVAGGPSEPMSPSQSLNRSLAGLDDTVSKACLNALPDDAVQAQRSSDASTPGAQPAANPHLMAGHIAKTCRVEMVCLPGNSAPVEMMLCPSDAPDGAYGSVAGGSVLPAQDRWHWTGPAPLNARGADTDT